MSKVLVKVSLDWADEFTCREFKVFADEGSYQDWTKKIRAEIGGSNEIFFGTNEYHEFENYGDFEQHLTVSSITDEEALVFMKYFGNKSFGTSGLFNV